MATHSSILAWRIPVGRGAWRATVYEVTKSWTQLSNQMYTHTHTHTHKNPLSKNKDRSLRWIKYIQVHALYINTHIHRHIYTHKGSMRLSYRTIVSYYVICCLITKLYLTLCDTMDLQPSRIRYSWDFPGKNTELGCYFPLQGIFSTQGLNPGLLHCRQTLYCLIHQGSFGVEQSTCLTGLDYLLCVLVCSCCRRSVLTWALFLSSFLSFFNQNIITKI